MGNGQGKQVVPLGDTGSSKDDSFASPPRRQPSKHSSGALTHTGVIPSKNDFEAGFVTSEESQGQKMAEAIGALEQNAAETPKRSPHTHAAGHTPTSQSQGRQSLANKMLANASAVKPTTKPPQRELPAQPASVAAAHKAAGRSDSITTPSQNVKRSRKEEELHNAQQHLEAYSVEGINYTLLKLIGKGAYGAVYLAEDATGNRVAVKYIVNAFTGSTDSRRIFREIKVMQHFKHPNIIELQGVILPRDTTTFTGMYIVSELMETDLHRVIHSRQDLTSDHISYFIYQLLCALKHLHAASVLHRDLKPANLLVNSDCSLKICDFGLARETDVSLSVALTEYVVTRWYRAPEVLLSGGQYTAAIDVWSVGCILGELLMRRPLFPGENYLHQLQLIMQTLGSPSLDDLHFVQTEAARQFILRQPYHRGVPFSQLMPHVRGPCLDLLHRMLLFDPHKRITIDEALAHPFMARVRAARSHVSEIDPPAKFVIGPRLRKLSVDAIRELFVQGLCLNKVDTSLIQAGEQVSSMDGRYDSDESLSEEEVEAVTHTAKPDATSTMYYNAVDRGIDQVENAKYWASAAEQLDEVLVEAGVTAEHGTGKLQELTHGDSQSTQPSAAGPNPALLAGLLAKIQDRGNSPAASDGANFRSIPGAKQRKQRPGNPYQAAAIQQELDPSGRQQYRRDSASVHYQFNGAAGDSDGESAPQSSRREPAAAKKLQWKYGKPSQLISPIGQSGAADALFTSQASPPNKPLPALPARAAEAAAVAAAGRSIDHP